MTIILLLVAYVCYFLQFLFSGSVPSYYRDVYDILCPNANDQIQQTVFAKVMTKSGLDNGTLSQVNFY